MKKLFLLSVILFSTVLIQQNLYALTEERANQQCYQQSGKIEGQYEKALQFADNVTVHRTCKLNPCTGTNNITEVTSFSGFDWHNSGPWELKETEQFNFGDGNVVYVDTANGLHTTICGGDEGTVRVAVATWEQWSNNGSFTPSNELRCSVGGLAPDYLSFCDFLPVGTDQYCTYNFYYLSNAGKNIGDACDPIEEGDAGTGNHFDELHTKYGH